MKSVNAARFSLAFLALAGLTGLARADAVDDYAKGARKLFGIPGMAYGVVKNGKLIKSGAVGEASLELGTPAKADTVFEIGSMTKQFTAAIILMLAQEGKLGLDDPIEKVLLDAPKNWRALTLRQCLSHTAGLKDYLGSYGLTDMNPVRYESIVKKFGDLALDFEPGTAWSYSNTGYLIATLAAEKVTGKKLEDLMSEKIFKPLGMSATGTTAYERVVRNRAVGYAAGAKSLQNALPMNVSLANGAGFLLSTIADLTKWEGALQTDKLLKAPMREEFFRPVILKDGTSSGYALGWFVDSDRGNPLISHGGNTAGFSANILRAPKDGLAVIVLTNAYGQNPEMIGRPILGLVAPKYNVVARKEVDPKPERTLRFFATSRRWSRGVYDMDPLSTSMRSRLNTLRGISERSALVSLGKVVKSYRYLDGEKTESGSSARYLVGTGPVKAVMQIEFSTDDKVMGIKQLFLVKGDQK